MPISKKPILDTRFFNALGKRVARKYKDHIWNDEDDVYGRGFRDYKEPYRSRKREGKLSFQHGGSRNSKAPFVVGDFKNDFKYLGASGGGFRMGWTSFGNIVNYLAEKKPKRVVTAKNQPIPKDIQKFIMRMVEKKTDKKYPKNEVIRIKIGKK